MTCLLPDWKIKEMVDKRHLIIEPFSGSVEPASYDLRMGYRVISLTRGFDRTLKSDEKITVHPGELILIQSMEKVGFPLDLQGRICSKVGWLKRGLSSIATKIDPGYGLPEGWNLLLVFHHVGHEPIELSPGIPICSLEIEKLLKKAEKPYAGKEPTILLKPIEVADPLSKQKELDFTKLKKEDLEKFYGHPLDDLFLAVGTLQRGVEELKNRLPKPRPLWKIALIVYFLYFFGCIFFWFYIYPSFPLTIEGTHLLAIYGIGASVIGVVLGLYSKRGAKEVPN